MEYLFNTLFAETVAAIVAGCITIVSLAIGWAWGRYKLLREFKSREMRDVFVTRYVTIEIDEADGHLYIKPRGAEKVSRLADLVPNTVLAEKVIAATKRGVHDGVKGRFVVLDDPEDHRRFMNIVREFISPDAKEGHLLRMFGYPVKKNDAYVSITYARDGDDNKIKLLVIPKDKLMLFQEPGFAGSLQVLEEEGSHDDVIEIQQFCSDLLFGDNPEGFNPDDYAPRVQLPTRPS